MWPPLKNRRRTTCLTHLAKMWPPPYLAKIDPRVDLRDLEVDHMDLGMDLRDLRVAKMDLGVDLRRPTKKIPLRKIPLRRSL